MGRRWGKTFTAGTLAVNSAFDGAHVAWVAPTYINARPMWRFAETAVSQSKTVQVKKADREIVFPSGGRLGVYTGDNDAGLRGEAFHLVIMEEAAQMRPETYTDVIMPTLADYDGRCYLISTPKGRNWYFTEYMRGLSDGKLQASFTAPSSANPSPQIRRAAELAKTRVSERTYRQEWLAEFVEDGALFVNITELAKHTQAKHIKGHTYAIGVDWARSAGGDYTVFTVIDGTDKRQVAMVRMGGAAFDVQMARLKALWAEYGQPQIIAEYNSMGGPLVERLQQDGLPVTGFVTTQASKHEIISALELAFDRSELGLIDDPIQTAELLSYEKIQRAGLPSYSAPAGQHDDTVIALALAWHGAHSQSWYILGEA